MAGLTGAALFAVGNRPENVEALGLRHLTRDEARFRHRRRRDGKATAALRNVRIPWHMSRHASFEFVAAASGYGMRIP